MTPAPRPSTRIILWSLPRSVSTAFEHSVRSLAGVRGFHEPYSAAYYLGEEMRSPRYKGVEPVPDCRFQDIKASLESDDPGCEAFFVKDMAYTLGEDYSLLPEGYTHSFLIRDPRWSIPSLYRILESGKAAHWDDFIPEEFDYAALARLREHLFGHGQVCPIIDSEDLLAEPAATMRAYCDAVGLAYDPAMLSWDSSESEDRWAVWGVEWYETLSGSNGFMVRPRGAEPELGGLPGPVLAAIEAALPVYEGLRAERLVPAP